MKQSTMKRVRKVASELIDAGSAYSMISGGQLMGAGRLLNAALDWMESDGEDGLEPGVVVSRLERALSSVPPDYEDLADVVVSLAKAIARVKAAAVEKWSSRALEEIAAVKALDDVRFLAKRSGVLERAAAATDRGDVGSTMHLLVKAVELPGGADRFGPLAADRVRNLGKSRDLAQFRRLASDAIAMLQELASGIRNPKQWFRKYEKLIAKMYDEYNRLIEDDKIDVVFESKSHRGRVLAEAEEDIELADSIEMLLGEWRKALRRNREVFDVLWRNGAFTGAARAALLRLDRDDVEGAFDAVRKYGGSSSRMKLVNMLREAGVHPRRALALAKLDDAARELLERLVFAYAENPVTMASNTARAVSREMRSDVLSRLRRLLRSG